MIPAIDSADSFSSRLRDLVSLLRLWHVPFELVVPTAREPVCLRADHGVVEVRVKEPHWCLDGVAHDFEELCAAVRTAGGLYLAGEMLRRFALS